VDPARNPKNLDDFIIKMGAEGLPRVVIDLFSHYYRKIVEGETGLLSKEEIRVVDPGELKHAGELTPHIEAGKRALSHAVMIKLNGGLGTSMGLTRAKSLLEVKNGKTFLDIILHQAESCGIQLALMNSFSTHEDTQAAFSRLNPPRHPLLFLQHKFPKILKEGFAPATWPENPALEWNPPGHGDIYTALYTSGMLHRLLKNNIRYAFISNSDNLGAAMDESLLGYFAENAFSFMMEVAQRTPIDMKGGHLARHHNGRLILREIAQCPGDELDTFQDIGHFKFFNTNNIWVHLEFLQNLIEKNKTVRLPMIRNPKRIDPRDETSPEVYQIETAMGAAISLFEGATAVSVPRSRLVPVKTCNDLLMVRSDCYVFSETGTLTLNPRRRSASIQIRLDPEYYGKIDQFNDRFKAGPPSLVDCESFTVEGDVFFEGEVTIRGDVSISNHSTTPAVVKKGSVLDRNIAL
jgi:UTP--glucose-1-phosphate uridylyltransferase